MGGIFVNEKGINVLEEYNLNIESVRRGRGILLVETNQGVKKLVELKGTQAHVDFQNMVQEIIFEKAEIVTDSLVKNKNGELVTTDKDGKKYVLKNHIEGAECDIKNSQEIAGMARNLAKLHKYMQLKESRELTAETQSIESLRMEFEKHNKELRKIRRYIRTRSHISMFETKFLKEFEEFYKEGEEALEKLGNSSYLKLSRESLEQGFICHGDYNYHNVIFTKNKTATINFEKCHVGIQMEDLYDFMRKILEKNNWDKRLGKKILAEYRNVREISSEEQENLYIRLLYPEKFWKLANQYFNSNKAWISGKTVEKLEAVSAQNSKKQEFLKEFMEM